MQPDTPYKPRLRHRAPEQLALCPSLIAIHLWPERAARTARPNWSIDTFMFSGTPIKAIGRRILLQRFPG